MKSLISSRSSTTTRRRPQSSSPRRRRISEGTKPQPKPQQPVESYLSMPKLSDDVINDLYLLSKTDYYVTNVFVKTLHSLKHLNK